ncbi:SdiA-regulated domain-containing protein [Pseudomonas sp. GD03842]|uniref:SdiA-regulated domain-containing protein n=1 Tax=unclassified Pseudomonas TaxID=196821 RepID=UPI000D39E77E|nr:MULTISPECIES: SdiA-regulated domain-containing protein [unclassified Pseudomonas]MDH0745661.1 SdiA-regulated domain-containing protein [Pseudomonas sp. GD03842]RAU46554.1 DNA-binding protein [Pseudomonas sp. RIT 409]RAU52433.1 DNA-binding protein [Pseudomonas sp. RIT 412]
MRYLSSPKTVPFALLLLVVLAISYVAAREFRVPEHLWFNWQVFWQSNDAQALGLDDYEVAVEARVIEGLEDNVSALSFDPDRKTLFTVTNKDPELIELSLDGRVLRRIPLSGFGDAEAVEYISPGVYVISDEHSQRLIKVQVDDETRFLDAADAEQLTLGIDAGGNSGFEGLAYDNKAQRLFVAKERRPVQIIEVRGFPYQQGAGLEVTSSRRRDAGLFVRDLSSLQFDERSGHLLALSDESRQILELDIEGRPVGNVSLTKGNMGLSKTVPQAEGIAMGDDGTLYLVSEPNLFYVFKKR